MSRVIIISAFGDNFIYLYRCGQNEALAVDPTDGASVLRAVKTHGLSLSMILATHHHWDHTGGIAELKKKTGCRVVGGDSKRIPAIDQVVEDGDILTAGDADIQVIATPGHTRTSVCYYMPAHHNDDNGILFTGDTLFVGGCGRLFECDAQTMRDSLMKLAALPETTLVYPGHDYTEENYEFALTVEPENEAVKERLRCIRQTLNQGGQTVPSRIFQEQQTNLFLRADSVEAFAQLRRRKDRF